MDFGGAQLYHKFRDSFNFASSKREVRKENMSVACTWARFFDGKYYHLR